ncbi:hypothetical protein RIF29_21733 [Crotalaria pallida]|uniref:Uncharacterized protein n=1 Tax=Crotalaria pallida TaxID=3830 RepID=A0AAN9I670_CROPI
MLRISMQTDSAIKIGSIGYKLYNLLILYIKFKHLCVLWVLNKLQQQHCEAKAYKLQQQQQQHYEDCEELDHSSNYLAGD